MFAGTAYVSIPFRFRSEIHGRPVKVLVEIEPACAAMIDPAEGRQMEPDDPGGASLVHCLIDRDDMRADISDDLTADERWELERQGFSEWCEEQADRAESGY